MKLTYPADQVHNPLNILRQAGYQPFTDPVTKKDSFILRLTSGYYPRFHLYVKETEGKITFDLHLDQKKPSYKGSRMHGGEYEGPTVEKELTRIAGWVSHITGHPGHQKTIHKHQIESVTTDPDSTEQTSAQKEIEHNDTQKQDLFGGIFN